MKSFEFSESEGIHYATIDAMTYRLRCKPIFDLDSDLNKVGENAYLIVTDDVMTGLRYTSNPNPTGPYFTLSKFNSPQEAIENLELKGNSAEITHTVYFLSGTTLGIADMKEHDVTQLLFHTGSGRCIYVRSNNTCEN